MTSSSRRDYTAREERGGPTPSSFYHCCSVALTHSVIPPYSVPCELRLTLFTCLRVLRNRSQRDVCLSCSLSQFSVVVAAKARERKREREQDSRLRATPTYPLRVSHKIYIIMYCKKDIAKLSFVCTTCIATYELPPCAHSLSAASVSRRSPAHLRIRIRIRGCRVVRGAKTKKKEEYLWMRKVRRKKKVREKKKTLKLGRDVVGESFAPSNASRTHRTRLKMEVS